jgi:hypothetical protein
MANRKISDLTALTAPATGDLLPIVDISEAAAADKNKKITYGELLASAPLGTAAAPSIAFEGDNTGIYSPGADQLAISTGGTSRIVVDASGNVNIDSNTLYVDAANNRVGIGTTTPTGRLDVNGGTIEFDPGSGLDSTRAFNFNIGAANFAKLLVPQGSGGALAIHTGGVSAVSERARIDSSGRLLVGTSTAFPARIGVTSITPQQQLAGNSTTASSFVQGCASTTDTTAASHWFVKFASGTINDNTTVVANNETLGNIFWSGSDGVNQTLVAQITAQVDGTPGADDMPGRLMFSTTADGASSPTEALRITNDRVIAYNQPTPTSKSAAATLTIAELKTGIIQYTGAAATLTLPTGTLMEGGFSSIYTNMAFEWSVINTGTGICTIGAGTTHTIVGTATVAIGASARFVSRQTAANTFVSYRLS